MLADRVRAMGGGGLPSGAVSLLHFESNLKDEVQGVNWADGFGNMTFDADGKFGYGLKSPLGGGHIHLAAIDAIDFAKRNFTISFWTKPVNINYSRNIVNKANYQLSPESSYRSLSLGQVSGDGTLQFYLWGGLDANGTLMKAVSSGSVSKKLVAGQRSFIKFGRKDTTIFLIIDGVKATTTIESNFRVNNTSQWLTFGGAIGNSNDGYEGISDEFLLQMDTGDDSLIIPTSQY